MKIIFMGTPDFSVGTLEALIEAGHEVCLVVTQPDKPKGRGKEMQPTPVKAAAMKHGIPVYQPKKIRDPECVEELRKYQADVMVVIAFGQILPKEILDMTPYGCINVHASLLPSYRGAAPIQWAVINGDETRPEWYTDPAPAPPCRCGPFPESRTPAAGPSAPRFWIPPR